MATIIGKSKYRNKCAGGSAEKGGSLHYRVPVRAPLKPLIIFFKISRTLYIDLKRGCNNGELDRCNNMD